MTKRFDCKPRFSSFEHSGFLRHPSFVLRHYSYSYLSATTGSRREAVHAGAKPEARPVATETIMLAKTRPREKWIGNEGKAFPIPKHIKYAIASPMNPPSRQSAVDSIRNCKRIVRRRAPSAFLVPISFVR